MTRISTLKNLEQQVVAEIIRINNERDELETTLARIRDELAYKIAREFANAGYVIHIDGDIHNNDVDNLTIASGEYI